MVSVRLVWVVLAAFALIGCGDGGPALYPATGTVTLEGKKVDGATVVFISDTAPLATGITDSNGKFSLTTKGKPGAATGDYKVTVAKQAPTTGMPANPKPEDMMKMAKEKTLPSSTSVLPVRYSLPQSPNPDMCTNLTATVTTDKAKNDFPLDLKP